MTFLAWSLGVIFVLALAFTIYYQTIVRVLRINLRADEIHTITTPDGWRIRLFRYRKGGTSGAPVLLVHGYTSNHWNLALPAGESLVDYLVGRGYDCWTIDLRGNRTSIPPAGIPRHTATYDGYVLQDLPVAVSFILRSTNYETLHWVGHSMGGMLLYAYELVHGRKQIASGTTIASPPWLEANWTKQTDRIVWLLENFPHSFEVFRRALMPIFAWLKPNHPLAPIRWDNLSPSFGVKEFFSATEQTAVGVTRTFEDGAKHRYLAVDHDRVNVIQGLGRLETPLLVMGCALDSIAPLRNLRAFYDRLPSKDKRLVELSAAAGCERDYEHVDPPFARNAKAEVFAPIAEWLDSHRAMRGAAPAVVAAPVAARVEEIALPAAEVEREIVAPLEEVIESELEPSSPTELEESEVASTSWGKALASAASILSGLEEGPKSPERAALNGHDAPPKAASRKPAIKKRATKTKLAAKTARAGSGKTTKTSKPAASTKGQTKARNGKAAPAPEPVVEAPEESAGFWVSKPERGAKKSKPTKKRTKDRE